MAESDSDHAVDATGLKCPEPVMMLHAAIRRAEAGETVLLTATDPSTQRDVANFCEFLGHNLLESTADNGQFIYRVRKAG
ncbi:putative redox protein, regulator of disulfide bond formation [gamma proteobacterium HIMB55]|nr:putative redox protein, regulator of disulfide bond formation [gamma proteobacterium HIMB55]